MSEKGTVQLSPSYRFQYKTRTLWKDEDAQRV